MLCPDASSCPSRFTDSKYYEVIVIEHSNHLASSQILHKVVTFQQAILVFRLGFKESTDKMSGPCWVGCNPSSLQYPGRYLLVTNNHDCYFSVGFRNKEFLTGWGYNPYAQSSRLTLDWYT